MNHIENLTSILESYSSVEKVYLYGSRNGNNYKEDSDYDICIVLNSILEKKHIVAKLGDYMICNDLIIHPIIITTHEYLEKVNLPIYKKEIFTNGTILINRKTC